MKNAVIKRTATAVLRAARKLPTRWLPLAVIMKARKEPKIPAPLQAEMRKILRVIEFI